MAAIVIGSFPAAAQRNRVDNRPSATDGAFMGGGIVVPESVVVATPAPARPRLEAAPVPNARIQAPREAPRADVAQVQPTFIAPRLPGRGHAQETGSPGDLQDRLFRPAPGAQVRIPVIW
ncbi:hypothetical protein EOD42_01415 [Rhodovarius crocodyli]|uniref:Uncharacterized protein n=1 Tax=Rhodovarius crocodyli TaxID=1979269 RepID=A0A437MMB6_9PROT|nr:hypothetical protein [Rhodovarius crocodyli]RVT98797.1 hypothetical protein EOD42_01415 [Rhodovarius crocodyli]